MRNTTIAIIIAATASILCAPTSHAATTSSKEEALGVGSGAVIGAFAAGPVGFIVGAAVGAKIGDTMHQKNEQLHGLKVSLGDSRNTVDRLENDVETLGYEIDRLQALARPQLVDLLQAGIVTDLLFRTDEYALADTTGDRLSQLAATLASMPDIQIQLDGFADERGDETYNYELSEKRVEFVRGLLVSAGIHPDRISVSAHGESAAQDDTPDSFALERRVSVTMFIDEPPALASNPD